MAAEIGLVGLLAFMVIPGLLALQLWQLRASAIRRAPHLVPVASAFLLALAAYFMTAVFLHLAFQPYYWFLIALSAAATHCLADRLAEGTLSSRAEA
jgi:hypothetical protein